MSRLFFLCFSFFLIQIVNAQAQLPDQLREWQDWVLEKHTDRNCPILYSQDEKYCVWPSELAISVNAQGGTFDYAVEVFSDTWVKLPGDQQFWPTSLVDTNNNQPLVVRDKDGQPEVLLTMGQHKLQGRWLWNAMPRTLTVPDNTGIISLVIDNKTITSPFLESSTQLLLNANKQSVTTELQDNAQINVFRYLQDDVPLKMQTRITLDISGKERELHLGQALINGFRLLSFNSELPARIEKDGSLRVQVKSGSWVIHMESQSQQAIKQLGFNKQDERIWPDQEIWVFAQKPDLRSVQISGVASIDPQQTLLPDEWRELPAYLLDANSKLSIEELQRGGEVAKNQLSISRKMWLDFSGDGFTVRDKITGDLHQGWRLETQQPFALKSAKAEGEAQLITQLMEGGNAGIEIRQRRLDLEAVSRVENQKEIPISGWSSVFNEVSTELVLPPGWSLITATGTSYESGSWIENWSLWNLFLVLILSVAIAKIIHPAIGLLALFTLVLIFHRDGSPTWSWLNLVAILALLPYVSGKFRQWIVRYLYISFAVAAIIALPFAVQQAREFFYPQQEFADKNMRDDYYYSGGSPFAFPGASPAPMMEESMKEADAYASNVVEKVSVQNMRQKLKKQQYDPNQILQTGPGLPAWSWRSAHLTWSGPVVNEEITRFYLVSPFWNRLGSLLSCVLSLFLVGLLLKHFFKLIKSDSPLKPESSGPTMSSTMNSALLMVLGLLISFSPAGSGNLFANSIPDEKLLQELEARLTAPAKCLPNCASIESATVKTNADRLWLNMTVHAADKIALPLPGQAPHWWPDSVLLNGKPASLLQNSQGQLFIVLAKGKHKIELSAALDSRESIDLNFGMPVHHLSSQLEGWQLNGNTQGAIRSLQLQPVVRTTAARNDEQLRPDPVPAFVIVRRSFNFDIEWSLHTEVIRVAPSEGVINLEIPLLSGEAPLSGNTPLQNLSTDKQKLQIRFDKQQSSIYWDSRLAQTDQIKLVAAEEQPWIEIWEVQSSAVWHLQTSGLAGIQPSDVNQPPTWQPWPGESLTLTLKRPTAVKGDSLVIESAELVFSPSKRASTSNLSLAIKTSQANQFDFQLPENASLNAIELNHQKLNLSPVQGVLRIPLQPGEQQLRIEWQTPEGISTRVKSPLLDLGIPTANQSITIQLPGDRWPLYLSGPSIGPSVLIWGILIVVLLLATQLGKRHLTPLTTRQWILLSLGIASVNLYALMLIAIWLLVLQWRSNLNQVVSTRRFKWMQLSLFLLSVTSLGVLIAIIPQGLLSTPDMHIQGNGSSAYYLRWYQDISAGKLAEAWVFSLPLWIYKLVMLLWSLWLASSLIRWLVWGWRALGHQGFWNWSGTLDQTNTGQR